MAASEGTTPPSADTIQRFEEKVLPEPNSGCWLWTGALAGKGYGNFWNGAKNEYAHRFSYRLHRSEIAVGLQIDHKCRNICCVNPDHLEPVTCAENLRRGDMGRFGTSNHNAVKERCPKGHTYSGDNLYLRPDGSRECRECLRDQQRWRRQKQGHRITVPPRYTWRS